MADEIMTLAGDFPAATHEDWLDAVDRVLKGKDFDKVLRSRTPDGIVIEPLYTLQDEGELVQVPAHGISRRASNVAGLTQRWDVRQRHVVVDPAASNAAILADLNAGVTSIELVTAGLDDQAALDAVLSDVLLDLAPVSLVSDGDGLEAAQRFLALAEARDVPPSGLVAYLGCDPIGQYARTGIAGEPIGEVVAEVGRFGAACARTHPRVRAVRADGALYAEALATPATELAVTVATGLAYVRAMVEAGLEVGEAFDQVLLSVAVGTDQFGDIAKLRALRVMWARVASVCGAGDASTAVQATTAASVITKRDPWVNMLRVTIGCFAAATGGADIIVLRPFDSMLGAPDPLGLRIARNTQLALMEESNLHRVIDPAGGSWYVEKLTDQLAAEAWGAFRGIESCGGVVAALQAGSIQDSIDVARSATEAAVANRTRPLTGVSEFPDLDETPVHRSALPESPPLANATAIRPVAPHRLAEGYERLRDVAEGAADEPTVFLANLGPVAAHTARASWAKNFFEAGGIRAVGNAGFDNPQAVVEAFRGQSGRLAVICSSDPIYQDWAAEAAQALRAAGAERVYLAGHPGEHREAYESAGVDEFIHVGCNVLDTLSRAHQLLGLTTEEAR